MKQIPIAPRYYATEDGEIWDDKAKRFKKQTLTGIPQYKYTTIEFPDGSRKLVRVHRLVCMAYHENPDNLPQVDHKDRDKLNNHKDNLRWVTKTTNQRNTSVTLEVEYQGEMVGFAAILDDLGKLEDKSEYQGLRKLVAEGMTLEEAIAEKERRRWVWNPCRVGVYVRVSGYTFPKKDGVMVWFPTIDAIAETVGVGKKAIRTRMEKATTFEDLFVRHIPAQYLYTIDGETKTRREWLEQYRRTDNRVSSLMTKRGYSFEQALKAPMERAGRVFKDQAPPQK